MAIAVPSTTTSEQPDPSVAEEDAAAEARLDAFFNADLPEGYETIRADGEIQFAPLEPKMVKPPEPNWFVEMLGDFFTWLGDIFGPIGGALSGSWGVLQWVLLGALVIFVLYFVARTVGPLAQRRRSVTAADMAEPEWQPDHEESLALLEDADKLAEQGRFDEAAHLLLKRSVGQIRDARPDWVDPSSTARELAALPKLSDAARQAFAVISEAVERSLFALRSLSREDWERARAAYADFALSRIEAQSEAKA